MVERLEIHDVSLADRRRSLSFWKIDGQEEAIERAIVLADSEQDELEAVLGDGNASVSVSAEIRQSVDYGNVAGCFVTVKLTCGQTESEIERAHQLAQNLALKWADSGQEEASGLLNKIRGLDEEEEDEIVEAPTPRVKKPKFRKG